MSHNGIAGYEVILLRHGETVGYDGDHGLTERGESQARDRGVSLASELAPGTTVRMLHARTARATATAAALRSSLLDAVGETGGIDVGALQPETWFDNLRVSVDGTVMDAADAVVERLALTGHDLPDWAHEYDRFDRDYGPANVSGGPVDYWLRNPSFYFEPPQVAAFRILRGVVAAGAHAAGRLVVVVATHSAPMRAFVASAIGSDPGEPHNLEAVRVHVDSEVATIRFRDHSTRLRLPHRLPAWVDEGSLTAFRHRRAESA